MNSDNIFDEMNLPLANDNENLSIISENKFKPLFAVEKFLIRSEQERDKGIDFQIELKYKKRFTNFRFAVQLKATGKTNFNKDGSISFQIDTSNLNYLLNHPMPAFYVLYVAEKDCFYYENAGDFARLLGEKDNLWNKQKSHALRFSKQLIENSFDEIYNYTLDRGKFQRKINERIIQLPHSVNKEGRITIDGNLNVIDDEEIRNLIEGIGFEIINEGKWQEVILLHKKATGNVATTSLYNLIIGIANYYSGHLVESLSFLKASKTLEHQLPDDLRYYRIYFELMVRFSIGQITKKEYLEKIKPLEEANNVGLYIKLENAKKTYVNSSDPEEGYKQLIATIDTIINDPNADENIILNARCELILLEGNKINLDYIRSASHVNAVETLSGPNIDLRKSEITQFVTSKSKWVKDAQQVKSDAVELKNYFVYFTAIINEIKVEYEFAAFSDAVYIGQEFNEPQRPEIEGKQKMIETSISKVESTINYYRRIKHIENLITALSLQFELLSYLNRQAEAEPIISEIETLIETYDLHETKRKLNYLKDNGATHKRFESFIKQIFEEANDIKKEMDDLFSEMKEMDAKERQLNPAFSDTDVVIELFPIGHFRFPMEKRGLVYEIINLTEEAQKTFECFWGELIPVSNILNNPITQEGYLDGRLDDKGPDSWRNIYRIRKAFYENSFYRHEIEL